MIKCWLVGWFVQIFHFVNAGVDTGSKSHNGVRVYLFPINFQIITDAITCR